MEAYGDDARRCWDGAYDRDASQLAVNAYGEPQPTAAIDEGTPHEDAVACGPETTAQMLALPSVCTFQEVQEMQPVKGMGGKAACAKQRELRQVCLLRLGQNGEQSCERCHGTCSN